MVCRNAGKGSWGTVVRCHHSVLARGGLGQAPCCTAQRPHFSEPVRVPEQDVEASPPLAGGRGGRADSASIHRQFCPPLQSEGGRVVRCWIAVLKQVIITSSSRMETDPKVSCGGAGRSY